MEGLGAVDGSDDPVPREEMRLALEAFWEAQHKEVRRCGRESSKCCV